MTSPDLTVSTTFTGLWVDDNRPLPEHLLKKGWSRAHSFHEAILKLEMFNFAEISLDHDLGSFYGYKELTGMDIVWWLVQRKENGLFVPPTILVHSANPVGHQQMIETIERFLTCSENCSRS